MTTTWWAALSSVNTVTSVPVLQVGGDGRWETASTVPVSAGHARLAACVAQAAATALRDVAVEVLWPGQVFVGARWALAESGGAGSAAALAGARRAQAVLSAPNTRPVESALLALLDSTPNPAPGFAELGAVNAWASVRPLVLRRRGASFSPAAVDEALASRPDLTECKHAVAIEIAVTEPRSCWIGVTVSTRTGPVHVLNRDALDEVLARVASTSC